MAQMTSHVMAILFTSHTNSFHKQFLFAMGMELVLTRWVIINKNEDHPWIEWVRDQLSEHTYDFGIAARKATRSTCSSIWSFGDDSFASLFFPPINIFIYINIYARTQAHTHTHTPGPSLSFFSLHLFAHKSFGNSIHCSNTDGWLHVVWRTVLFYFFECCRTKTAREHSNKTYFSYVSALGFVLTRHWFTRPWRKYSWQQLPNSDNNCVQERHLDFKRDYVAHRGFQKGPFLWTERYNSWLFFHTPFRSTCQKIHRIMQLAPKAFRPRKAPRDKF